MRWYRSLKFQMSERSALTCSFAQKLNTSLTVYSAWQGFKVAQGCVNALKWLGDIDLLDFTAPSRSPPVVILPFPSFSLWSESQRADGALQSLSNHEQVESVHCVQSWFYLRFQQHLHILTVKLFYGRLLLSSPNNPYLLDHKMLGDGNLWL